MFVPNVEEAHQEEAHLKIGSAKPTLGPISSKGDK